MSLKGNDFSAEEVSLHLYRLPPSISSTIIAAPLYFASIYFECFFIQFPLSSLAINELSTSQILYITTKSYLVNIFNLNSGGVCPYQKIIRIPLPSLQICPFNSQ